MALRPGGLFPLLRLFLSRVVAHKSPALMQFPTLRVAEAYCERNLISGLGTLSRPMCGPPARSLCTLCRRVVHQRREKAWEGISKCRALPSDPTQQRDLMIFWFKLNLLTLGRRFRNNQHIRSTAAYLLRSSADSETVPTGQDGPVLEVRDANVDKPKIGFARGMQSFVKPQETRDEETRGSLLPGRAGNMTA